MKFLILFQYLVVCIFTLLSLAYGLKCYNCMYYMDGTENDTVQLPGPIVTPVCKYGHTQNETLSDDCFEDDRPPDKKTTCGIIHVEGRLLRKPNATSEVILRSCMYVSHEQEDACFDFTAAQISNITGLPPELKTAVDKILPETPGSVCSCNGNNCNDHLNYSCRNGDCNAGIVHIFPKWKILTMVTLLILMKYF